MIDDMSDARGPEKMLGEWTFAREVDDRRSGRTHRVIGTARFSRATPDRIDWVEEGTMGAGASATPIAAMRSVVRGAAGSWGVDFADGRPFHAWSWGEDLVHDCAPDLYRGVMRSDGDGWAMRWVSTGPEKDYTIDTVYRRA